jgi:hypothetical protein
LLLITVLYDAAVIEDFVNFEAPLFLKYQVYFSPSPTAFTVVFAVKPLFVYVVFGCAAIFTAGCGST